MKYKYNLKIFKYLDYIILYSIYNMNYFLLGDILWYLGHILTGCSIIFSHINFQVSIALTIFGQFLTIISRPIGRINLNTKNSKVVIENA